MILIMIKRRTEYSGRRKRTRSGLYDLF